MIKRFSKHGLPKHRRSNNESSLGNEMAALVHYPITSPCPRPAQLSRKDVRKCRKTHEMSSDSGITIRNRMNGKTHIRVREVKK